MFRLVVLALLAVHQVTAYPDGAPVEACESMEPNHGGSSSAEPCPYTVLVEKGEAYATVILSAPNDDFFEGFFLQARDVDDNIIGTFSTDDPLAQLINCSGGVNNAVTHNSNDTKTSIISKWTPPSQDPMDVTFKVTLVREKMEYWSNQVKEYRSSASLTYAGGLLLGLVAMVHYTLTA